MKFSSLSKPISSPGRTEKFPPPLMRFLRSNMSNRSRPRSRKSPLFFRKKKPTTVAEAQEPSSPKVTCIGQVRVRARSKISKPRKPRVDNPDTPKKKKNQCKCHCFEIPSCCNWKCNCLNARVFRPVWHFWVRYFCCRVRTEISKTGSNQLEDEEETEDERERGFEETKSEEIEENGVSVSAETPPKNALLLTRCRSAPYRSSSLACRFWGSPTRAETEDPETGEERETVAKTWEQREKTGAQKTEQENRETPTLERELSSRDSTSKSRGDQEEGKGRNVRNCKEKEFEIEENHSEMALTMLKRSRSEPARRESEKLDPLTSSFWKERRSNNTPETCTPHAVH